MVWSFILPVYEWIFTVFGPSVRAGERAGGLCGGKQPTTERGSFGTAARTPCREAAQIVLAGPTGPARTRGSQRESALGPWPWDPLPSCGRSPCGSCGARLFAEAWLAATLGQHQQGATISLLRICSETKGSVPLASRHCLESIVPTSCRATCCGTPMRTARCRLGTA